MGVCHGVRCSPAEQWSAVIATSIFFNACVELLKAPQVFCSAFVMVEHDYALRPPCQLRQYVVLVAEVDENDVLASYIRRLLAVDARHKLDIDAKGFAYNPCSTKTISAVAVIDA